MKSMLYTGHVTHKRLEPFLHHFKYGVFMSFVDLDELNRLDKTSWLFSTRGKGFVEYRRSDFHGDPQVSLSESIRELVYTKTGQRVNGPIRMLSNLRLMGHIFNPATFYYCYDSEDTQVEHIIVEITNTPWNERHSYVLSPGMNHSLKEDWYHYTIDKDFHVSPFLDMNFIYEMKFNLPENELFVSIENHRDEGKKFLATLNLKATPFSHSNLFRQLIKFPFMTFKVVWGIYFQALKLKLKGARFYPHPGGLRSELERENL
jgi:DUF1365 family protein